MNERVKIFLSQFKYEGTLISEDDSTYTILDQKEGKIRIPKNQATLKYLGDRNDN